MFSHAPQNLTMPILVEIVPVNDNIPVVTVETSVTYYTENDEPRHIVPNITITDEDETCQNDQLSMAIVQIETMTNDSNGDQLMVHCPSAIKSFLYSLSFCHVV